VSVSRKEFLTRGLAVFGRELITAARGDLRDAGCQEVPRDCGALLVDNGRCLAQRGGCFSCLDRCPMEAIGITAGVGIVVDADLCNGCGECIEVCPVEPKPITLKRVEQ
jgi:Pyruvate/2-oxoacid:ferredoxin oxidoreductase delta subunit